MSLMKISSGGLPDRGRIQLWDIIVGPQILQTDTGNMNTSTHACGSGPDMSESSLKAKITFDKRETSQKKKTKMNFASFIETRV